MSLNKYCPNPFYKCPQKDETMKFWVHGNDTTTGKSRPPLFVEADHAQTLLEAARQAHMEITEIKSAMNSTSTDPIAPNGIPEPVSRLAQLSPVLLMSPKYRFVATAMACLFVTAIGIFPLRSGLFNGSVTRENVSQGFWFANLIPKRQLMVTTPGADYELARERKPLKLVSAQKCIRQRSQPHCPKKNSSRCQMDENRALCESLFGPWDVSD
ncbi:MAG: hypothetical protein CMJ80_17955 [Planctomycetaceae bacterium]|nr:hypothetical protein [Planctomycetaceae bacterium]